jgi:hypothetical protein
MLHWRLDGFGGPWPGIYDTSIVTAGAYETASFPGPGQHGRGETWCDDVFGCSDGFSRAVSYQF